MEKGRDNLINKLYWKHGYRKYASILSRSIINDTFNKKLMYFFIRLKFRNKL